MKLFWKRFWNDTQGQDLVEYALLVAAIALGMIATIKNIAEALSSLYSNIQQGLANVTS